MNPITVSKYIELFNSHDSLLASWEFAQTHRDFISKAITLDPKKMSEIISFPDQEALIDSLTRDDIMHHLPLNNNLTGTWKLVNDFEGNLPTHLRFLNHKSAFESFNEVYSPSADIYFTHKWSAYKIPKLKICGKQNYTTGLTGFGFIKEGKFHMLLEFNLENGKWIPTANSGVERSEAVLILKYNHDNCVLEKIKRESPEPSNPNPKKKAKETKENEESNVQDLPF